jgi:hypothetical protein
MAQHERFRPYRVVVFYAVLALAWTAFARWIVPPFLAMESPGPIWAAIILYVRTPPALFLPQDALARWRALSGAVLIAMALHLSIVFILRRYNRDDAGDQPTTTDVAARRRINLLLLLLSFAFLLVTVLAGTIQDYYFYLEMWYAVREGRDPWFLVAGLNGIVPLNAYGPLFNLLAGPAWLNSFAPKLLFAYAYILFAISQFKGWMASHRSSRAALIGLTALFWNPFPWVEIAIRGHFDILIGLLCLAAIRAVTRDREVIAGGYLALGVLLKYFPLTLLPFLALDRGRLRPRVVMAAVAAIVFGLGLSFQVWGLTTFSPLRFAATRSSSTLSIFRFIRGHYSPLRRLPISPNQDYLAPYILFLALLRLWSWCRARRPNLEVAAVAAAATTVLLYQTGFPQYQMVPFVLASSWAVRHWETLIRRTAQVVAIACYFGWLAAFDLYYAFVIEEQGDYFWHFGREVVGLPSFVFGCVFVAAVIWSAKPVGREGMPAPTGQDDRGPNQSSSSSDVSSRSSC